MGGVAWAQAAPTAVPAAPAVAAAKTSAAPASAVLTDANPALWKVQGPHETVYLFGTVHVMKPDVKWQTPKVMSAFKASDTLYLEVEKADDPAVMQPLVVELGMDPEHPLSSRMSKEDIKILDDAAKSLGAPGEQVFDTMKPWLAYMTLQILPMLKAGYNPTSGVDMVIAADAKGASKPVVGFETVSQQMHYFADMTPEQQVALLHSGLADLPEGPAKMDEIVGAWTRGDVEKIGSLEDGEFRTKYPLLYKRLVVERNGRFADQLATLLKGDKAGTIFVAVGAAHLAGPDSVQHALETLGFKAVRQ